VNPALQSLLAHAWGVLADDDGKLNFKVKLRGFW
jgi:hypothetical protein